MRTAETEKKIREAYGKILSGMSDLVELGFKHVRCSESFATTLLKSEYGVDEHIRVGQRQIIIISDHERDKPWCDAVEKAIASVPVIRV